MGILCLVEISFKSVKALIQSDIYPKRVEGRDWKPFIRRLCYSAMTLSAPGLGLEKELQENPSLALNYGYDSLQEYRYVQFDKIQDGDDEKLH